MTPLWAIIAAGTAGVLLPKVLPAMALPGRLPASIEGWLRHLPLGLLGAFAAIAAAGYAAASPVPWLAVAALGLAGAVALVTRKTIPALLCGWVGLASLHIAGLV